MFGPNVKAVKVLSDSRGLFILLRIKSAGAGKSIAVALADLNTERMFRLLGRHCVPLISNDVKRGLASALQSQVAKLLKGSAPSPLAQAGVATVEPPLG